jgi:hypothetical protein
VLKNPLITSYPVWQRRANSCLVPGHFAVEVTNRVWIKTAVAPFAQRKFSILLDTRPREEHYHVEVSLFEARLPLLSPFAVSLKDKLRIERQHGRTF